MYRITFIIEEDMTESCEVEAHLTIGTMIDVELDSGQTMQGHIVSVRISYDREDA